MSQGVSSDQIGPLDHLSTNKEMIWFIFIPTPDLSRYHLKLMENLHHTYIYVFVNYFLSNKNKDHCPLHKLNCSIVSNY